MKYVRAASQVVLLLISVLVWAINAMTAAATAIGHPALRLEAVIGDTRGVTSRTDRLGHTTSYTYDEAGRILTLTDPLGNTVTYAYNAAGRRTALTDGV